MRYLPDIYYDMHEAKTPRKKYKYSLQLIAYFCEQGDIIQAQQTLTMLANRYAKEIGLTEENLEKDTERMIQKGYKNAVPRIIKEIGDALNSDDSKNFRYMEYKIREARNYATESRSYSPAQMEKLEEILLTLRNWILDVKAKTPLEKIIDFTTITKEDIDQES